MAPITTGAAKFFPVCPFLAFPLTIIWSNKPTAGLAALSATASSTAGVQTATCPSSSAARRNVWASTSSQWSSCQGWSTAFAPSLGWRRRRQPWPTSPKPPSAHRFVLSVISSSLDLSSWICPRRSQFREDQDQLRWRRAIDGACQRSLWRSKRRKRKRLAVRENQSKQGTWGHPSRSSTSSYSSSSSSSSSSSLSSSSSPSTMQVKYFCKKCNLDICNACFRFKNDAYPYFNPNVFLSQRCILVFTYIRI